MSLNALRLFMEMDTKLFEQCTEQYRREFLRGKKAKEENDRKWEELEQLIQVAQKKKKKKSWIGSDNAHDRFNSEKKNENNNNMKNFCALPQKNW